MSTSSSSASSSDSKGFGLGNLVSSRFSGESYSTDAGSYNTEKYSSVGGSVRPVITEDVEIKGELAFSGELEFNGRFEGQLKSGGSLSVGEAALIKGTINAESAIIAGKVQGDIIATGRIHLRPEAMVFGDIKGKVIVIEEGALVDGKILISDAERPTPDFDNMFSRVTGGSGKSYSTGSSSKSSSGSSSATTSSSSSSSSSTPSTASSTSSS